MSQFDSLLDFDAPAENGTTQKVSSNDDFDPFGPSPTIEAKGVGDGGGGDMLLDFGFGAEVIIITSQRSTSVVITVLLTL
jgi:hypothetical protein